MTIRFMVGVLAFLVAMSGGTVMAADQLVAGKLLLVKNPNPTDAAKRKINYKVNDKVSAHVVVGDPMSGGATLAVQLDANMDCYSLPASGWSPISTIGFKYKDGKGDNGPVQVAQIKKTPSGTFQIKVKVNGRNGSVGVVPPNPGVQADTNLTIGGGDSYCSTFGGDIGANTEKTFKAKNAPAPVSCNVACAP